MNKFLDIAEVSNKIKEDTKNNIIKYISKKADTIDAIDAVLALQDLIEDFKNGKIKY